MKTVEIPAVAHIPETAVTLVTPPQRIAPTPVAVEGGGPPLLQPPLQPQPDASSSDPWASVRDRFQLYGDSTGRPFRSDVRPGHRYFFGIDSSADADASAEASPVYMLYDDGSSPYRLHADTLTAGDVARYVEMRIWGKAS